MSKVGKQLIDAMTEAVWLEKLKLWHFKDTLSHEWVVVRADNQKQAWAKLKAHLKKVDWVSDDGHSSEEAGSSFSIERVELVL